MDDSLSKIEVREREDGEDEDEEVDATEEEVSVAAGIEEKDEDVDNMAISRYIDSQVHPSYTNETIIPGAPTRVTYEL